MSKPRVEIIKALRIRNINPADIVIADTKTNNTVAIKYKGKALVIETPFLIVNSELKKTLFPDICQLDTLFSGESRSSVNRWYKFIEDVETRISEQVSSKGASWFTHNNVINKSLIRDLNGNPNDNFIKWAINMNKCSFVNVNKNPYDVSNLRIDDLIKLIVEFREIWINGTSYGLAVNVRKVMVKPHVDKIINDYDFNQSDSESSIDGDGESVQDIISVLSTEQKPGKSHEGQRFIPVNGHNSPNREKYYDSTFDTQDFFKYDKNYDNNEDDILSELDINDIMKN